MNLKEYPIIKEYEVFPSGSTYVALRKGIETDEELTQYLGFCDEIVEEAKKLENEIKK